MHIVLKEQFRRYKKEHLELLTTVDMAVENLKQEGKNVSLESVKELIQNNKEWIEKLKRPVFSDNNIASAIEKSESLFNINFTKE